MVDAANAGVDVVADLKDEIVEFVQPLGKLGLIGGSFCVVVGTIGWVVDARRNAPSPPASAPPKTSQSS